MKSTLLFALVLIFSACGNKEANENEATSENMATDSVQGSAVTDNDRQFVMNAAAGGMMEVELGNLAQQNAKDERVKAFGAMMVRDHSKANDELTGIASSKNIQVPASMGEHHQQMVEDLKKKSGNEFDQSYMDMMVDDHEKDITSFQRESNQGHDADIKNFAANTLPVLQTHLDSAKAIHDSLKGKKR